MHETIMVVHVLASVGLVALILLQHGKGADIGAAFGSGASSTLFGSRGSANFLTRLTAVLATVFFITSMSLTVLHLRQPTTASVTVEMQEQQQDASGTPTPPMEEGEGPSASESIPEVPK